MKIQNFKFKPVFRSVTWHGHLNRTLVSISSGTSFGSALLNGKMFGLLRHLFKFQFLFVVAAVLGGIYHTEIRQFLRRQTDNYLDQAGQDASIPLAFQAGDDIGTLFTPAELAKFNGEEEGRPLYLALLGSVFDVSRGIKHYGSGCSYNFFVGRDASVSFISGDFETYDPETADDVLTLKPDDLIGLAGWRDFYQKDYVYKGRVIGRFYDEKGALTTYHHKFLELLEQARDAKRQVEELRLPSSLGEHKLIYLDSANKNYACSMPNVI